jgi:hypothetical protein
MSRDYPSPGRFTRLQKAVWLLQRIGEWLARPAFRRGARMLVDAAIVMESFALALLIRFNGEVVPLFWRTFWPFVIFAVAAFVVLLYVLLLRVARATAIATVGLFIVSLYSGPEGFGLLAFNLMPLSVILIGALLAYLQLVAVRLLPRALITS